MKLSSLIVLICVVLSGCSTEVFLGNKSASRVPPVVNCPGNIPADSFTVEDLTKAGFRPVDHDFFIQLKGLPVYGDSAKGKDHWMYEADGQQYLIYMGFGRTETFFAAVMHIYGKSLTHVVFAEGGWCALAPGKNGFSFSACGEPGPPGSLVPFKRVVIDGSEAVTEDEFYFHPQMKLDCSLLQPTKDIKFKKKEILRFSPALDDSTLVQSPGPGEFKGNKICRMDAVLGYKVLGCQSSANEIAWLVMTQATPRRKVIGWVVRKEK